MRPPLADAEPRTVAAGPAPVPDLTSLTSAARRAFACDVVLVAVLGRGAAPQLITDVDAAVSTVERRDLRAAVTAMLPQLARGEVHAPRLASTRLPGAQILLGRGYHSLVAAELAIEGEKLGALVVLRRDAGLVTNAELIGTFSRQTALAVAQRRWRRRTSTPEERLRHLEALDQVALSSTNFDELSDALGQCIAPMFGAQMTGIMVWDEHREVLQLAAGSFGAGATVAASYQIAAQDSHSNAARVFDTGQPYLSNDAVGDSGILSDYVDVFGIRRLLSLQLAIAGRPIGVLHLANKPTDFTLDDLRRAEVLAPRIATVVELARAMFELRRKEQLETVLSWVAVKIASGQSLLEFLPRALGDMCEAMDAGMMAITPEGAEPILHRRDASRPDLVDAVLAEAKSGPGVRAYVIGPEKAGDPGWATYYRPVNLGRQRIGTLAALRLRGEPFSLNERQGLSRVANLAALGWASERYQQQRAELARLQERQRIADDLHDDVAQILFAAHLSLDAILESPNIDADVASGIARSRGMLIRGDQAIRRVIHQLTTPVASDLPSRLTAVVSGVEDEFSIPVHLEVTDAAASAASALGRPAGDALLKVAREALVNAAKHAGPCRATVHLDVGRAGGVRLRVVDDGVGMPAAGRRGHGLTSLRRSVEAHGGRLRVRKGAAGGTTVTASVPV